jgi:N-methylhydantoinase A
MTLRVGVDIGGTFTDLVFIHAEGRLVKRKVPSTPDDYARAILDGVRAYCAETGLDGADVDEVVHATTVATNAILERRGVRTALITTSGFRDVLELRRIRIPLSYDLGWKKPAPLVPRALRFTVEERLDAQGEVLVPFEPASLGPVIEALREEAVEAVAVSLLHAYREGAHERAIEAILTEHCPDLHVSLSSEVLPEMMEFERTSTTVVNAYIHPLIARYLARLRAELTEEGVRGPLLVMQSNGGLVSANTAAARPVTIIESGPAAGVIAAARLAQDCGYPNVLTLDMGGTTTKASIIEGGEILRGSDYEVGSPVSASSRLVRGNGYLLRIPVIDISEVGAGGGSIAALDPGGALRVGPRSAGAAPGPACYGMGNEEPTVTDANLVLGYIDPNSLAGGALPVERGLAEAAIARGIGKPGGLGLLDAAYGIHVVANSNMVRAIKSVSVERGRDPAEFSLMAFGGAGPIHAAEVARALGIRQVIVPPGPGVFSAFGLLRAEIEHHAARTVLTSTAEPDLAAIQRVVDEMRDGLIARARDEGFAAERVAITAAIDLRYRGQSSELTVPFPSDRLSIEALRQAEEKFEAEFERTYGHRGGHKAFELVTFRLVATVPRSVEHRGNWQEDAVDPCTTTDRDLYFGGGSGTVRAPVSRRAALAGRPLAGPAVIQEYDTTVVIPPGCTASLDRHGNVVVAIGAAPQ